MSCYELQDNLIKDAKVNITLQEISELSYPRFILLVKNINKMIQKEIDENKKRDAEQKREQRRMESAQRNASKNSSMGRR